MGYYIFIKQLILHSIPQQKLILGFFNSICGTDGDYKVDKSLPLLHLPPDVVADLPGQLCQVYAYPEWEGGYDARKVELPAKIIIPSSNIMIIDITLENIILPIVHPGEVQRFFPLWIECGTDSLGLLLIFT